MSVRQETRLRHRLLAILLPGLMAISPAAGTAQRLGKITSMGEGKWKITRQTQLVQIHRGAELIDATPDAGLRSDDSLRVQPDVSALFDLDYRSNNGVSHLGGLTFSPELQKRDGERPFRHGTAGGIGTYWLSIEDRGPSVSIEQGALSVRWDNGTLIVITGGTTAYVTGTRVAWVAVSKDTAAVYVTSGSVEFRVSVGEGEFQDVSVGEGQTAQLINGQVLGIESMEEQERKDVDDAIQYNTVVKWLDRPEAPEWPPWDPFCEPWCRLTRLNVIVRPPGGS